MKEAEFEKALFFSAGTEQTEQKRQKKSSILPAKSFRVPLSLMFYGNPWLTLNSTNVSCKQEEKERIISNSYKNNPLQALKDDLSRKEMQIILRDALTS